MDARFQRAEWWGVAGLFLISVLLVFAPFVVSGLSPSSHILADGDSWLYFYPAHVMLRDFLLSGSLPLWSDMLFAGFPVAADPQLAAWFLPGWPFLLLPPVMGFHLKSVAFLFFALLGTWFYLRRLGCGVAGAWIGALAFGLGGTMMTRLMIQPTMVAVAAFLPWMALTTLHRDGVTRNWPVTALLMGGTLLGGHPQVAFIILTAFGLVWLLLAMLTPGNRMLALGRISVAALLALGVAAVQLLPTAALSRQSVRPEITLEFFASYQFEFATIPLLFFPFLMGYYKAANWPSFPYQGPWNLNEMAVAPGSQLALVAALLFLGVLIREWVVGRRCLPVETRRQALAWASVGTLFFLLSLGINTPLGRLLYHMPVFGLFRAQVRFFVPVQFAIGVCAGLGIHWLIQGLRDREGRDAAWRLLTPWLGWFVLATSTVVCWVLFSDSARVVFEATDTRTRISRLPRFLARNAGLWLPLVLMGSGLVASALVVLSGRRWKMATAAAIIFVTVATADGFLHGFNYQPRPRKEPALLDWQAWNPGDGRLALAIPYDHFFHHDHHLPLPMTNVLAGFPTLNGHSPLAPGELAPLGLSVIGAADPPQDLLSQGADALRSLSVTTIAAPSWMFPDVSFPPDAAVLSKVVLLQEPLMLDGGSLDNLLLVELSHQVPVDTYLRVEVTARRTGPAEGHALHVDLYGTDYDYGALELVIPDHEIGSVANSHSVAWFTGDAPQDARLRVFTRSGAGIVVESITIEHVGTPFNQGPYIHGGHRSGDIDRWNLEGPVAAILDDDASGKSMEFPYDWVGHRRVQVELGRNVSQGGILRLPIRHDAGWRAWLASPDGRRLEASTRRGENLQLQVLLRDFPSDFSLDNATVTLEYSPKSTSRGIAVSIASLLLLIGLLVVARKPENRSPLRSGNGSVTGNDKTSSDD